MIAPNPETRYIPWTAGDIILPTEDDLEPILWHDEFRRIATDPVLQAGIRRCCERSPWFFLVNFVVTVDEHWDRKGLSTPYQRFPPKQYLCSLCERWCVERKLYIPKSRQVMATWEIASLYYGDAIFLSGRLNMFQSKLESDATDILRRIKGVDQRLRQMAPWLPPAITEDSANRLAFANDSALVAVAQGKHQVQSHTPSGLFADEAQLQDEMGDAYEYALAACDRMTIVGTADYGWLYQVALQDRIGKEAA